METDYFFRMGKTHTICQDYAAAGEREGHSYAILSDGCSGVPVPGDPGSPHTDFGSRFLVRAAGRHLQDLFDGVMPLNLIASEAANMAHQARLPKGSLDATLLVLVNAGRYSRSYQVGDGVVAVKYRDGRITYYDIEFGGNMPYYPIYALNRDREHAMLDASKTATAAWQTFTPGEGWGQRYETTHDLLDQFRTVQTHIFDVEDAEYVFIMSDGAKSFVKKGATEAVPLTAVVEQVCNIKSGKGDFLQRRLRNFLDVFCVKEGWAHKDDFSCAAINHGPYTP